MNDLTGHEIAKADRDDGRVMMVGYVKNHLPVLLLATQGKTACILYGFPILDVRNFFTTSL